MSSEELNWRKHIDPAYYNAPLHALRYSVCHKLALYLDAQDVLVHSGNGIVPNFGGLAECAGFDGLEISGLERAQSPTKQLLTDWKNRPELEPTVGRLIEFLTKLGREDVLTDCCAMIGEDVKFFLEKTHKFKEMRVPPIQDQTVTAGPGFEEIPPLITRQDVINGQQTRYDAFICYNPMGDSGLDLEFVKELIKRFEGRQYSFKLFVPYRDDLGGLNAHTINAKIISERCRHMIVVLSPNFLASQACEFQSTFAHALSPGARNKRIVPIKIQDCPTPNILRIMACCDFTKRDLWDWSWDRLAKSIMVPLSDEDFQVSASSSGLEGLIQSGSFDLNSTLESGVYSRSSSPLSSRSSSPGHGHRQNITEPIMAKPSDIRRPVAVEMNTYSYTAPVESGRQVAASPSGPFRRLKDHFSDKRQKTKK